MPPSDASSRSSKEIREEIRRKPSDPSFLNRPLAPHHSQQEQSQEQREIPSPGKPQKSSRSDAARDKYKDLGIPQKSKPPVMDFIRHQARTLMTRPQLLRPDALALAKAEAKEKGGNSLHVPLETRQKHEAPELASKYIADVQSLADDRKKLGKFARGIAQAHEKELSQAIRREELKSHLEDRRGSLYQNLQREIRQERQKRLADPSTKPFLGRGIFRGLKRKGRALLRRGWLELSMDSRRRGRTANQWKSTLWRQPIEMRIGSKTNEIKLKQGKLAEIERQVGSLPLDRTSLGTQIREMKGVPHSAPSEGYGSPDFEMPSFSKLTLDDIKGADNPRERLEEFTNHYINLSILHDGINGLRLKAAQCDVEIYGVTSDIQNIYGEIKHMQEEKKYFTETATNSVPDVISESYQEDLDRRIDAKKQDINPKIMRIRELAKEFQKTQELLKKGQDYYGALEANQDCKSLMDTLIRREKEASSRKFTENIKIAWGSITDSIATRRDRWLRAANRSLHKKNTQEVQKIDNPYASPMRRDKSIARRTVESIANRRTAGVFSNVTDAIPPPPPPIEASSPSKDIVPVTNSQSRMEVDHHEGQPDSPFPLLFNLTQIKDSNTLYLAEALNNKERLAWDPEEGKWSTLTADSDGNLTRKWFYDSRNPEDRYWYHYMDDKKMLVIRPSKGVLECYQYEGNDEWDATNLDNEIFGSYLHKDLSAIPEGPNIGQVPDMDEIPPTVREITLMVRRLGSKNICVGENAGKVEEWETLVAFKLDGEIRLAENPEQLVGYFKSQGYTKMSGLETETIELKITGPEQIEKMLSQNKFIDFEGTDGQKAELELLGLDEAEKGLREMLIPQLERTLDHHKEEESGSGSTEDDTVSEDAVPNQGNVWEASFSSDPLPESDDEDERDFARGRRSVLLAGTHEVSPLEMPPSPRAISLPDSSEEGSTRSIERQDREVKNHPGFVAAGTELAKIREAEEIRRREAEELRRREIRRREAEELRRRIEAQEEDKVFLESEEAREWSDYQKAYNKQDQGQS